MSLASHTLIFYEKSTGTVHARTSGARPSVADTLTSKMFQSASEHAIVIQKMEKNHHPFPSALNLCCLAKC